MSASIQNNNNSASPAAAEKVKKPALSAQSTKHMVFGNWLIERLVAGGQLTQESVTESRKILGMWSSVEEQITLYDGFAAELKASTKEMKAIIRQFHKPPKATKKAASEGEKKRGRKKKEVVEEQDPVLALNQRLIAAAQSDEPIVEAPEYVRAPNEPESDEIKTPEPPTEEELAKPAKPTKPIKKKRNALVIIDEIDTGDKVAVPVDNKVDEKLAKANKEAAKESEKLAKAAEKEAAKESEKLAKAAEKAEKESAKEAEKLAKAAEKAEKEAAKAAKPVKEKKEPKKKGDPAVLPIPELKRNSPIQLATGADDEEEEEELECEVFKLDGVEYLIDSLNNVYDRNTQDIIGTYDSANKKINKH
jgi:chemotaxis protein histidine kinase CheA